MDVPYLHKGVTNIKVLVAYEESQRVCTAFRAEGHEAYSCDILDPSGGHPEWHIKGDVLPLLDGDCTFSVMGGGASVTIDGEWDMIIAHPPCTYLSNAGACRLYPTKGVLDQERCAKGLQAKDFFMTLLNAKCRRVCVENPIPSKIFDLPPYTQTIQPYWFGEPYSKKTCLWLRGLPPLHATQILNEYKPYVSCSTSHNKGNPEKAGVSRRGGAAKVRSRTFWGIAKAMATQWSNIKEDTS